MLLILHQGACETCDASSPARGHGFGSLPMGLSKKKSRQSFPDRKLLLHVLNNSSGHKNARYESRGSAAVRCRASYLMGVVIRQQTRTEARVQRW